MLELIHARLTISMRLALIGALFLAPIVFLVYLFVVQSVSDIDFAKREIDGTRYLGQVWPTFIKTAASGAVANGEIADRANYDAQFGTADVSAAFANAKDVAAKLDAGKTFIGAVADKSNLTLDPDLDSFYAMDAATVRIPGIAAAAVSLAQAVAEPEGPTRIVDVAFAVDHLRISSDDAAGSLDSAMKDNAAGVTSKTLAAPAAALKVATDALLEQGKAVLEGQGAKTLAASEAAVLEQVDAIWGPTNAEVARLLQARVDGFNSRMIRSLAFAGVFLAAAILLSLAIGRGLSGRLQQLLSVMDRLVANDAALEVPFVNDANETGRIAKTLAVFKEAVIERSALKSEKALVDELAAERGANEAAREKAARNQTLVVSAIAEGLGRLAQSDFTVRIDSEFPEEFDRLRVDLNAAALQLRQALVRIDDSARGIHSGAGELSGAIDNLQGRTEQQAASLEETAAALDEITATVRKSADGAAHARKVVAATDDNAKRGVNVVGQAVEAMAGIAKSADQISQIIGLMDEIAFQTNLLALNAGVEAARAGDAGRGFAVVASEVRALAQRSAEAAKEIKTLISASSGQVEQGVKLVAETGRSLERIMSQVAEINTAVNDIAGSANEQATGLQEINVAINQMDQVTQQNAAMVEESTAACHALATESEQLASLIGQFRISAANEDYGEAHEARTQFASPSRSGVKGASARRAGARCRLARPRNSMPAAIGRRHSQLWSRGVSRWNRPPPQSRALACWNWPRPST